MTKTLSDLYDLGEWELLAALLVLLGLVEDESENS